MANLRQHDTLPHPATAPGDIKREGVLSPEAMDKLFINERGEIINAKVELFTNPIHGESWRRWAAKHLPVEIFREFGLIDADGSEEWLNVVEHSIFVTAASLTLANQLAGQGISVDTDKLIRAAAVHDVNKKLLIRAAIVHDAAKRRDIETRGSREHEPYDYVLANVLLKYGYSYEEIETAKNTGRLPDRYVTDPELRYEIISHKSVEATILGYCDARTRGSRVYSLDDARQGSISQKSKPKDVTFFNEYWFPYYLDVEKYLRQINPDFNPEQLTDEAVSETVVDSISE